MKKNDLENGMIVELKNGDKYIVIKNFTKKTKGAELVKNVLLEINGLGYMPLNDYTDDLLRPYRGNIDIKYDIMKVYCFKYLGSPNKGLELLWEREGDLKTIENQLNEIKKYFRINLWTIKKNRNKFEVEILLENGEETLILINDEMLGKGDTYIFNAIRNSINIVIMNGH